MRCDNVELIAMSVGGEFQSTHLHEVRLLLLTKCKQLKRVSIHAPT